MSRTSPITPADIEAALIAANGVQADASRALGMGARYICNRSKYDPTVRKIVDRHAVKDGRANNTPNTKFVPALEKPLEPHERAYQPKQLRPLFAAVILDAVKDADAGSADAVEWLGGNPAYRLYADFIGIPAMRYEEIPPRTKRLQMGARN